MALVRSAIRRASRKGRGFATPWDGMAERRPQRVAMQGRRAGRHSLFSSHVARDGLRLKPGFHIGSGKVPWHLGISRQRRQ
jgi:hypothetical protein